ncbi:MAG TPA: hypothetical protein VLQ90_15540, partial [Pyrinomonadaceae bacterium]|nr:hypothetical protein [Pyrinomonadaceae bacterium]
MIIPSHTLVVRAFTLVALTLLLAPFCFSQPRDVLGWETARWGMSNQNLVSAFGTRLQKLPKPLTFLKWHADYVLTREIDGRTYTVFFQMANDTNKLSQVLVRLNEMESRTPREGIFN